MDTKTWSISIINDLRGYVDPSKYYGYETQSGVQITGTEQSPDISAKIQQLCEKLDIRDVEKNNEVPDEIKDRLEDLGYA